MIDGWGDGLRESLAGVDMEAATAGLWIALLSTPLVSLVHELGHAAVALTRTEGLVRIRVGRAPGWVRGRVGRLDFELSPILASDALGGSAQPFSLMGRGEKIAFALAGPAAEALLLAFVLPLIGIADGFAHDALLIAWGLVAFYVLVNLVPFRRRGIMSDGRAILEAIRTPPSEIDESTREFENTLSRSYARLTDRRDDPRKGRRGRTLQTAAMALGYAVDVDGPGMTARWFALVGWCWREAERGVADDLRPALLDAYRKAGQEGFVGGLQLANAARVIAGSGLELGLGSPGRTEAERKMFFATAFRRFEQRPMPWAISEGERWFAFRFGVAVHDLEDLVEGIGTATAV